jgi:hypothetical protein
MESRPYWRRTPSTSSTASGGLGMGKASPTTQRRAISRNRYSSARPMTSSAALLDVPEGSPCLHVERVFTNGTNPVLVVFAGHRECEWRPA